MSPAEHDLDLDAMLAAREEQEAKPKRIRFRGETFELPAKLPFRLLDAVERLMRLRNDSDVGEEAVLSAYIEAARAVLGDEYEAFLETNPTQPELDVLIYEIPKLYGTTMGESPASDDSSASNGSRSRPTSKGSTGSSSRPPASARAS